MERLLRGAFARFQRCGVSRAGTAKFDWRESRGHPDGSLYSALTTQRVANPQLFLFRDLQSSYSLLSLCSMPLRHAGEYSLCQDGERILPAPSSGPVARARRSMRSVRPVFRSRSEKTCSAWRPVASIAVMLRARSTTTAANFLRSFVSSASLSVVPNKNDP
jgi:hypothetical protein